MKRVVAVVLTLTLVVSCFFSIGARADRGDLIRFIPTEIEVTDNKVKVEGYFVNMNKNATVMNFTEFEMKVFLSGDLIVEGDFGDINEFSIAPMRLKYQSFTFNGSHDLNEGTYTCDDDYYATFTCHFQYSE